MEANLEYYKVFYYVVTCGSVTQAADRLALSQPAVSQSVKQLEDVLGTKLFRRTPQGLKPTSEGALLFSYVEKGYAQFEAGEKRLLQLRNLERGEITIGASDMTLRFFLLPFLERFHEKYPAIRISVTNGPTPSTMQQLREGKIDFGVVSGPLPQEEGIGQLPVGEVQDIYVAGRRFAAYAGEVLPLKQLEALSLITMEPNTSTRSYLEHFWAQNGVKVNPEFELATSDMIVQFAVRNLGVGSVVRDFARAELEAGRLLELRFEPAMPPRQLLVVTDLKNVTGAAAGRLLEMIREAGEAV